MNYVIGCEMIPKINAPEKYKQYNGLYALSSFGLSFILTKENVEKNKHDIKIPMFDSAKDAQLYAQYLSRVYRRDDVYDKRFKSKFIRRFYPLKVNSLNFGFKITNKGEDQRKIDHDRFGNSTKNNLGTYNMILCDITPKTV